VWEEKVIRQVAMQLFLSSHGVRPIVGGEILENDIGQTQSQMQEVVLPMRYKADTQNASQVFEPVEPPTISASIAGSLPTAERDPSPPSKNDSNLLEPQAYELGSTLQKYTAMRLPAAHPESLRRGVQRWNLGNDPVSFKWQPSSQSEKHLNARKRKKSKNQRTASLPGETDGMHQFSHPSTVLPQVEVIRESSPINVPILSSSQAQSSIRPSGFLSSSQGRLSQPTAPRKKENKRAGF
jgi:hypothetical protein